VKRVTSAFECVRDGGTMVARRDARGRSVAKFIAVAAEGGFAQ